MSTRQSPKLVLSFNPLNAQNVSPGDCGYDLFTMNYLRGIFTMKVNTKNDPNQTRRPQKAVWLREKVPRGLTTELFLQLL